MSAPAPGSTEGDSRGDDVSDPAIQGHDPEWEKPDFAVVEWTEIDEIPGFKDEAT